MKEQHLWNFIYYQLSKNKTVMLVAVVNHENGSPGKEGFKMAITSNGDSVGSIGGGIMEFNIVKSVVELLKKKIQVNKIEKLYHSRKTSVKKSGLICAGSQTNFFISLTKKDIRKVKGIMDFVKEHREGKIIFDQAGINFAKGEKNSSTFFYTFTDQNNWRYEETIGLKNTLIVAGCGHVGLAVCRLFSMLDFYVIAFDNRKDLPTMKKNIFADKKIIDSYENLSKHIAPECENYVIIVTTGYETDKESLKQVIGKNVKYIGLMGTRVKIKKIFNEAVKEGVKKELLKTVNAPIGIDINSDTPEEIAVSIAAEVIREKNTRVYC